MAFAAPLFLSAAVAAGGTALPWLTAAGSLGSIASAGGLAGGIASVGLGISSVAGPLGTILTGLGGLASSRAEAQAAKNNAALYNYNAAVKERNALLATKSAELRASEQRRDNSRRIGTIRSAYSKAGVVSTAGSPLLTQQIQAGEGEMEVRKILFEGLVQSQSDLADASIERFKAATERNKAKTAKTNGMFSFANTILTGASTLS